jgi:hypothetical protein
LILMYVQGQLLTDGSLTSDGSNLAKKFYTDSDHK